MKKNPLRQRIEVKVEELDRIIDGAKSAPLSESDSEKLKTALHALAERLLPRPKTEKTSSVSGDPDSASPEGSGPRKDPPVGHGRNGAAAYRGAEKVEIAHSKLTHGDRCPDCSRGNVYTQKEPKALVRIVGQAPLAATIYELERLRCNTCGQVFIAEEPEAVGPEKYDETAALIQPAHEELVREAGQGEVLHNDDTSMRVLQMERDPGDDRTGVFTTGIVSVASGRKIALYFTGRQHAGENLADVVRQRAPALSWPIQMCDALSRNAPKLSPGVEILLANCLAHGRRQFVEVAQNFPEQCRYVLESLGSVYAHDAAAREQKLSAQDRLQFHQQQSGPVMGELHGWLKAQLAEKKTEPNSDLGKAITYLLRHWKGLTAFLREAGAPLDNNICERALKRAVLHRKNALFYKTLHGAEVGDVFMSLIHTCQLCGANSFEYLTELQRHAQELALNPAEWMPWNYREALARSGEHANAR